MKVFLRKIFALVLLAALASPARAEEGQGATQVTSVEGDAGVLFAGSDEWVSLETDVPLETGDRVRTGNGARVEMVTPDGDALEVQDGSELEIGAAAPKESAFRLLLGGLLAKIAPDPGKKFRVFTPVAVAAVRGTEFAVDVDEDGGSELGVSEGTVAFQEVDEQGNARGEEVKIAPEHGAGLKRGERLRRFAALPPAAKRRLVRMAGLRGRAPLLRARWRNLPLERRREIRGQLRQKWQSLSPQQKDRVRQAVRERRHERRERRELRRENRRPAPPRRR
jgi:hypothetical protein